MKVTELATPCLVLDRGRLAMNTTAMATRMQGHGVQLRPHLKTAKSAEVARLAAGPGGPITVSTLAEADYFLSHGFADITYGVGITADKLNRAAALLARGADLTVMTDQISTARALADHGAPFKVLIEIDCGDHRGGLSPTDPGVIDIAKTLTSGAATVSGVLTHAGHSYECQDTDAIAQVAEDERAAAVAAADALRAAGIKCPTVSVGSTPTAMFARDLSGVTEVRCGIYMVGDLFQSGIGALSQDDLALSVLATVIGVYPGRGKALIDAGGLALSKDRSCAALQQDCGYGLLLDAGGVPLPGLMVSAANQEHGHITETTPGALATLGVGDKLRVLPNHACMTAAAYDGYHVVDGATEVIAWWDRCNGW